MDSIDRPQDLTIDGAAAAVTLAACRLLDLPAAALLLVADDGTIAVTGVCGLPGPVDTAALDVLVRSVWERDDVIRVAGLADDEPAIARSARVLGLRSLLLAPLRRSSGVAGALLAGGFSTHRFTDAQREIAAVLADQAAAQITGIRLLDRERAERRRTVALLEVAQAVTRAPDLETALARICRAAAIYSVAHRCTIFLTDATGRPRPMLTWDLTDGAQSEPLSNFRLFQRRLEDEDRAAPVQHLEPLTSGGPLILDEAAAAPAFAQPWIEEFGVRSLAIYPLITRSGSAGLMALTAHDRPVRFPAEEVEAMSAIALQAASVIEHLSLLVEVREQAVRDGLTGLYNHRYLKEALQRELLTARRDGQPLAVALLDVDGMKWLNDNHGHTAGDAALQRVAAALNATFRPTDTIARYGGDEFLVLMPNTDLATAVQQSEHVLAGIAAMALFAGASIGIAVAPDDAITATDLLDAADAAMYAAKRGGSGGIALARDQPAPTD